MPSYTLSIPGMHCASCVHRISEALKAVRGVAAAHVSFATRSALVEMSPEALTQVLEALKGIGYPAAVVQDLRPAQIQIAFLSEARQWLARALAGIAASVFLMLAHPTEVLAAWISSIVVLLTGSPFFIRAFSAVRERSLNMDVLIGLGTSVAFVAGWIALYHHVPSHGYFDSSVMILALISLGRYLEMQTRVHAGHALQALTSSLPNQARTVSDGQERMIPVSEIREGHVLRILAGEKIPVDGCAKNQGAWVQEAFWTGQSDWREILPGQIVAAGSRVEQGILLLQAQKTRDQSAVFLMQQMVLQAQQSKAAVEVLVDRVSGLFIPFVLLASALTFALWMLLVGSWSMALKASVAVVIIACPCALGLATPTALMVGMGLGATMGILIRNAKGLEQLQKIKVLLLDKTGTLTAGELSLIAMTPKGVPAKELLAWTWTAEQDALHPISQAIGKEVARLGIKPMGSGQVQVHRGYGVEMLCDGHRIRVGRRDWLSHGALLHVRESAMWEDLEKTGSTVIGTALDGKFIGCLVFRDTIRAGAADAIAELKKMGYTLAVISGDQAAAVAQVAGALGIDDRHAQSDPMDKAALVRHYQVKGHKVAFVGDGINDSVALTQADLGIAMGTGAELAKESGDILLVHSNLQDLPKALRLGQAIFHVIRQNLFWAFVYNVAAIPMAALGKINPVVAAGAMAASSISVVLNSLSLRWGWRAKTL